MKKLKNMQCKYATKFANVTEIIMKLEPIKLFTKTCKIAQQ